jgi:hypothetical protein
MRRSLLFVVAFVVATSACAAKTHIGPGTRVRISASDVSSDRLVGEVSSLGDDTVALVLDETNALQPVPLASVERIEVVVAVPMLSEDCGEGAFSGLCDASKAGAVMLIPTFGGIGAIAGWLVGMPFFKFERWRKVPLDRLRVSVAPQRDGRLALAASISF